MNNTFQVVVLAGGKGQKLYPLSENIAKGMLPIANKCLISYQLEQLQAMGFSDIIVVINQNNQFKQYLEKEFHSISNLKVVETIDIIHNVDALEYISDQINKNFIIMPCDLITNINLHDILHNHILQNPLITVILKENINKQNDQKKKKEEEDEEYDFMMIDHNAQNLVDINNANEMIEDDCGVIIKRQILQHNPAITMHTDLFDTHIYICDVKLIYYIKNIKHRYETQLSKTRFYNFKQDLLPFLVKNQFNTKLVYTVNNSKLIQDQYQQQEQQNQKINKIQKEANCDQLVIKAHILDKETDIVRIKTISQYIDINLFCLKNRELLPQHLRPTQNNGTNLQDRRQNSQEISANIIKNSLIPNTCQLGQQLIINNSVLGPNNIIGNNCKINNSIIFPNVIIEDDCTIYNSILCKNCKIGKGSKINDNSIISYKQIVLPFSEITNEQMTNIQFE